MRFWNYTAIYMGGPDKGRFVFYSSFARLFPLSISSLNSVVIGSSWTIFLRQAPNKATVIVNSNINVETTRAKSLRSSGRGIIPSLSWSSSSFLIKLFSSPNIFVFDSSERCDSILLEGSQRKVTTWRNDVLETTLRYKMSARFHFPPEWRLSR